MYTVPFIYGEETTVDSVVDAKRVTKNPGEEFSELPAIGYAIQVTYPQGFVVGDAVGKPGDYLGFDPKGNKHIIPYEVFQKVYQFE